MFSLLLLCLSIFKVFCQNPITNIRVLDSYLSGASNFIANRPIFDGITLVLPKTPVQHAHRHPHQYHHPHLNHHRPLPQPFLHPLQLSQSPIVPPFHPLLLSQLERPDYQPVFRSVILPKNFDKYKKPKKYVNYKPKYSPPEEYHYNHRKKYSKSINDRLREKDYAEEEEEEKKDEEKDEGNKEEHQSDDEEEEDPLDPSINEEYEKPASYYDDLPPFRKQKAEPMKPMFEVKSPFSMNRTKDIESTQRPQSYGVSYPQSEPKYSERIRKPILQNDLNQNKPKSSHKESQSLFDSSPPYAEPDQFNFLKPKIQTNNGDITTNSHLSDSPQTHSSNYRKESPKKQRTATANQLYLKEQEKHYHKHPVKEEKSGLAKVTQSIPKEDLESNDDPGYYPHQYAIEIRWKDKNNVLYNLDAPKGDVGDREMHSSKELDHARHRKYKHEEEEHWHEKKWLNEGLKKAYLNGKPLPVRIMKPTLKLPDGDYSPLPIYAQPMANGATLDQINQHFAIPTPNFRVNNRFMEWAKNAIPISPLQNFLTLYG